MHRQNHYPKHVFSWVLLNPRTSDPPTNPPPIQRLTESIIIFGRLDNRNTLILQNTNAAVKTYNYTSVYYPKSFLVSIKHKWKNQLHLFF